MKNKCKKSTSRLSLFLLFSICMNLYFSQVSQAEEISNTSTVHAPADSTNVKDIDDEITNAKLRAATGAKSKWSFSSSLDYLGASVTNPFSTERPKLNDTSNAADPTLLSANLGIKYRMTTHDHLLMGVGVSYIPQYTLDKKTGRVQPEQSTVSNPHLDYVRLFRVSDVQNVFVATLSKYTTQEDLDNHLIGNLFLSHTMMTGLTNSKLNIGMYSYISQDYMSQLDPGQDQRTLYLVFGFNPLLEYTFNDKYSVRTSTGWLNWMVKNSDHSKAFLGQQSQTLGVGIAIKRDFYLYPNLQWKWNSLTTAQTTVGISANINL